MLSGGNALAKGALIGGGGTAAFEAWHSKQRTSAANVNSRP